MSAVGEALAIFLLLTFAFGFIGADLYLQFRRPRNSWKKRPLPQQRPMPHVGTRTTSRLLEDADLTQWLPRQRVPLPAETEENVA